MSRRWNCRNARGCGNSSAVIGNWRWKCVPEKSGSVLREGAAVSEKYAFIAAQDATDEDAPTIAQMSTCLTVSKSGFYEWLGRPASAAGTQNEYESVTFGEDEQKGVGGHADVVVFTVT